MEQNSRIVFFNNSGKIMASKFSPQSVKRKLVLWKDLIEPWKRKCGSILQQRTPYTIWMYYAKLVSSYNSTYHRSIKMAPNQVSLLSVGSVKRKTYMAMLNPKQNLSSVSEIAFVSSRVERHLKRNIYLTGQSRSSLFANESPKSVQSTS